MRGLRGSPSRVRRALLASWPERLWRRRGLVLLDSEPAGRNLTQGRYVRRLITARSRARAPGGPPTAQECRPGDDSPVVPRRCPGTVRRSEGALSSSRRGADCVKGCAWCTSCPPVTPSASSPPGPFERGPSRRARDRTWAAPVRRIRAPVRPLHRPRTPGRPPRRPPLAASRRAVGRGTRSHARVAQQACCITQHVCLILCA